MLERFVIEDFKVTSRSNCPVLLCKVISPFVPLCFAWVRFVPFCFRPDFQISTCTCMFCHSWMHVINIELRRSLQSDPLAGESLNSRTICRLVVSLYTFCPVPVTRPENPPTSCGLGPCPVLSCPACSIIIMVEEG